MLARGRKPLVNPNALFLLVAMRKNHRHDAPGVPALYGPKSTAVSQFEK
jgi:hypothetical protein